MVITNAEVEVGYGYRGGYLHDYARRLATETVVR